MTLPQKERERLVDAIHLIQKHLRDDWIVEGCRDERVLGCASCTMTRLHQDLDMLMYEIEDQQLSSLPSPPEPSP